MIRPETLRPFDDPDYAAPTHADLRTLLAMLTMTEREAAQIVGMSARAVRAWLASPDTKTHAQTPYAAWRLLLQAAGLAKAARRLRPAKGKRSKRPIMKSVAST
jgi:hypothetical protein